MSYTNKIGQTIGVGDVVVHAGEFTVSNIGVVTGFYQEKGYGTQPRIKVDVTWASKDWRGNYRPVRASVRLSTVTKVDPVSLGTDILAALSVAR